MEKKCLIAVFMAFFVIFIWSPAFSAEIVMSSSNSASGSAAKIANSSQNSYLLLNFVDEGVNRLRISDNFGRVFFDSKPDLGETIYLPPGTYTSTVWSGYGRSSSAAIRGVFVSGPRDNNYSMVQHSARSYGKPQKPNLVQDSSPALPTYGNDTSRDFDFDAPPPSGGYDDPFYDYYYNYLPHPYDSQKILPAGPNIPGGFGGRR